MRLEIQDRGFHTIDIAMEGGKVKQYKIPTELNVSEVERLLELQSKLEKLSDEEIKDSGNTQVKAYWDYIYAQVEIIFRHYQPEIDSEYLRLNILPKDALIILNFFAENRYINSEQTESKKN